MADQAVAARMFDARQALETRERRRFTLEELGALIATAEGRAGEPYAAAVVKRWLDGDAEPRSMATWRAIAKVFGVRVGWLAVGELPMREENGGAANPPIQYADPANSVALPERKAPAARKRRKGNG